MTDERRIETFPMWPSLARLIATLVIFVFHYLGLVGLNQHGIAGYALLTFSFLSGYLAHSRGTDRRRWMTRRYFSVMVPHWLVMIPVLVANWFFHYKPVSWLQATVTVMGGNLFLADGLYVITWYVTFVLLLYLYLLCESYVTSWRRIVVALIGYLVFAYALDCGEYFLAFILGVTMATWLPARPQPQRRPMVRAVSRRLFRLQALCYPFFLVHGAVLLGALRLMPHMRTAVFVAALALSIAGAIIVERATDPLLRLVLAFVDRRFRPTPAGNATVYAAARH